MKTSTYARLVGATVALCAATAFAQSSTGTNDRPKAIGTSQQTADEAASKAAKNGNDSPATFVRTGPTAGDHADNAMSKTKAKAKQAKDKVSDTTTTSGDDKSSTSGNGK